MEGQRRVLEAQLVEAFGPLPQEALHRLEGASEVELTEWAKRFRAAGTLRDVLG